MSTFVAKFKFQLIMETREYFEKIMQDYNQH